jgi:hypothetical protein
MTAELAIATSMFVPLMRKVKAGCCRGSNIPAEKKKLFTY